ncbi:MAG: hypothetical protein ACI8W8_004906 [Rhodothermales bacterium]|jgi:hypothetical protein
MVEGIWRLFQHLQVEVESDIAFEYFRALASPGTAQMVWIK